MSFDIWSLLLYCVPKHFPLNGQAKIRIYEILLLSLGIYTGILQSRRNLENLFGMTLIYRDMKTAIQIRFKLDIDIFIS